MSEVTQSAGRETADAEADGDVVPTIDSSEPTFREKLEALWTVVRFRPWTIGLILALKAVAALFEGVGLTFLLPIIEVAQDGGTLQEDATGPVTYFVEAYELIGVTATFETLLVGLAAIMTLRYGVSFLIGWIQAAVTQAYMASLRRDAYESLLAAEVGYLDHADGDEITNTIITEARTSARLIGDILSVIEKGLFAAVYATVALVLSPTLTLLSIFVLGTVVVLSRYALAPGYEIGDRVAAANERIQSLVNAGTRGLYEVKLFTMQPTLATEYDRAHNRLVDTFVTLERNQVALSALTKLLNAFVIFALVYLAIAYLTLSFAALGVFLFAMFRLSPLISGLNNTLYSIDGALPHLVRTQRLIAAFDRHTESSGTVPAPNPTTTLKMDDVTFQYDQDDAGTAITDVSLHLERGETIALAGPSGAGKSTVVSLLAGLYEPDEGTIRANGTDLSTLDRHSWYERVTVVPQQPFLFTGTLRYNVAIADPAASDDAIKHACELSQVSAFLETLPNGLDTELGDDGVRLSGGQRQRIAIARALLTDADILILDEATSELDSPTETAILDALEATDRAYATIVIGHWLSTVRDADRIYTVVDGEIVESGTHRELIARETHYATLYEPQVEPTHSP
ncbi:ABC transporter ATP-binding protein [Natronolimnobius sp. AArcel1]|uniref:ABC transporter ATP-binding protein n=1 Tax=Natronolimnobius sp. AArcel1 TaxID=1679093 RepID=UPI0013EB983E|nr:ABC transporter ATP-binding protein [Natronolimnobius sp. AArcel1]NGM70328.1 ABC transporter ATP-binding protein [Natronolimnobius sp. AArcel1]